MKKKNAIAINCKKETYEKILLKQKLSIFNKNKAINNINIAIAINNNIAIAIIN